MRSPRPAVIAVLLLCLTASACTGTDPDDRGQGSDLPVDEQVEGGPTVSSTERLSGGIALTPGARVDVDQAILDAAGSWIAEESGLTEMLQEELFLDRVTQTRDVYHLTFLQQHDRVSIRGAQFIVHVRDSGKVLGASQSLTDSLPGAGVSQDLSQTEAVDIATKSVPGPVEGTPTVAAAWLPSGDELRLGWEVQLTTMDPPSAYSVVVDATDGAVLSVDRLASDLHGNARTGRRGVAHADAVVAQADACVAPPAPSACIFVVDPISASGDPDITPGQADDTLVGVSLPNLTAPASGDLTGRFAQIAPPLREFFHDPDGVFGDQGRGTQDITFEAGMSYYWVDYTAQLVEALDYDFHTDDPVDLVPIEPQFPDNAFYLFTEDRIHMGVGADGVNEAEDAQGIIHEYGHAILQAAVPDIITEEGGAFHEGFGDLVSVFTTLELRNFDPPCLFIWAEQGQCLRRVDGDLVYPDDLRFEVHLDGEIFTGAVWEVFTQVLARDTGLTPAQCNQPDANPCGPARDLVYGTLLGSLPFLTPNLDLDDASAAFASSDQTFYDGVNADIITQVMGSRGLATDGSSGVRMGGSPLPEPTESLAAVKISHDYRGDLDLRLAVVDSGGQEQCRMQLLSPDQDDDGDNVTGQFPLVGSPCEQFLPPDRDRVWVLTAVDTLPQDRGTLNQFTVVDQGQRFLSAGLPATIPDDDPIGVSAAVGGLTPLNMDADGPAPDADTPPSAGDVRLGLDVAHTYVGDLQVQMIVANLDGGDVLCRIDLRSPDPQDSTDDLALDSDVSACSGFYPPSRQQAWVIRVADVAQADVGEVTRFVITGPDGDHTGGTPQEIPDQDATGLLIPITR